MNLLRYSLISGVFFLLLQACSSPSETLNKEVQAVLDTYSQAHGGATHSGEVLLIIPRTGCSSCIGIADRFFKQSSEDGRMQFVFTKISSLKVLKIRLGPEVTEDENVHLDMANNFSKKSMDSIYPIVVFLDKGRVQKVEFITPHKEELINQLNELALITLYKSIFHKT